MNEISSDASDLEPGSTSALPKRYRTATLTALGALGSALLGVGSVAFGLPVPLAILIAAAANLATATLAVRVGLAPIHDAAAALDAMAGGDLTVHLDEGVPGPAGALAASFNRIVKTIRSTIASFDESAAILASASDDLAFASSQIEETAELSARGAGEAATAANEVVRGITAVASGSQQFEASISEIARSAGDAVQMASQAVGAVEQANAIVTRLDTSAAKIGSVIGMITMIAEQTNLLALNATIEAARAGAAGRGFAVVAGEVQELARETSEATGTIANQIETLQADAATAAAAVNEIYRVISKINEYQLTISTAVDEQHVSTCEMNRGIGQIATGSDEIAANIANIAEAAQNTTEGVTDTKYASEAFAQMAADLRSKLSVFRV